MSDMNAATVKMQAAVERVNYDDWVRLRNEVDTIRCIGALFKSDAAWSREFVELRAFRDAHPLPIAQKPALSDRPTSWIIRRAEAELVFGEYCERESARMIEKIRLMEAGQLDKAAARADLDDRTRNEKIARSAIAAESEAVGLYAAQRKPVATAPQPTLFGPSA